MTVSYPPKFCLSMGVGNKKRNRVEKRMEPGPSFYKNIRRISTEREIAMLIKLVGQLKILQPVHRSFSLLKDPDLKSDSQSSCKKYQFFPEEHEDILSGPDADLRKMRNEPWVLILFGRHFEVLPDEIGRKTAD